ncbi:hypothetical protein EYF80_006757 [Liparis tanakae]|uniref:Uncharacterized protein n=1 Tax=Liparis tanakae TaxID=230148 RepID=A0A4Z2IYU4_9TELE|nr:hypothetical protein EYF80_006757 [Liparis tanakae]
MEPMGWQDTERGQTGMATVTNGPREIGGLRGGGEGMEQGDRLMALRLRASFCRRFSSTASRLLSSFTRCSSSLSLLSSTCFSYCSRARSSRACHSASLTAGARTNTSSVQKELMHMHNHNLAYFK